MVVFLVGFAACVGLYVFGDWWGKRSGGKTSAEEIKKEKEEKKKPHNHSSTIPIYNQTSKL